MLRDARTSAHERIEITHDSQAQARLRAFPIYEFPPLATMREVAGRNAQFGGRLRRNFLSPYVFSNSVYLVGLHAP